MPRGELCILPFVIDQEPFALLRSVQIDDAANNNAVVAARVCGLHFATEDRIRLRQPNVSFLTNKFAIHSHIFASCKMRRDLFLVCPQDIDRESSRAKDRLAATAFIANAKEQQQRVEARGGQGVHRHANGFVLFFGKHDGNARRETAEQAPIPPPPLFQVFRP